MGKYKKKPGGKGTYVYEFCVCDFVQLCDREFLGGVVWNRSERVKHKYKTLSSIEHLYLSVSI